MQAIIIIERTLNNDDSYTENDVLIMTALMPQFSGMIMFEHWVVRSSSLLILSLT